MQLRIDDRLARRLRAAIIAAGAGAVVWLLRRPLQQVAGLVFLSAAIAFLAAPLACIFEKRLSRQAAALACLVTIAAALIAAAWLLLPAMIREIAALARTLPAILSRLSEGAGNVNAWLEARLPGIRLPSVDLNAANAALAAVASGTFTVAVNLAGVAAKASLAVVLAYFLLCDRDALLLRLELLLPMRCRHTAVRMGGAVCRELRQYLRGQLLIALAVAALAAAGLALAGVRGALALGPVIGLTNMIPYFGPYIGGAAAVLIALGDGWRRAAAAAIVMVVVQQLDGSVISPRILGGVTGLSPAAVLVGIYAGARIGGVGGMLLALPALVAIRTLYRVFIQKS